MSYIVKEKKLGYGISIKVEWDDDGWGNNPLVDYDQPEWLKFVHWHRRSDWHGFTNVSRWEQSEIAEFIKEFSPNCIILPLMLYSHSEDYFSLHSPVINCQWDSGQVGLVLIDPEGGKKEYGWKRLTKERRQKLIDFAGSLLKEWDQWQRGEVYGYIVEHDIDGVLDSCWGFIGDSDYCMNAGLSEAQYYVTKYAAENEELELTTARD